MSDEIVYALLNSKIKKLAKKVEEGGLPEGVVIPTKLSDLENDLYYHEELVAFEAQKSDFKQVQYYVANSDCKITSEEAKMDNVVFKAFVTTAQGSVELRMEKSESDEEAGAYLLQDEVPIAAVSIGKYVDFETKEVIEEEGKSFVMLLFSSVLQTFESVQIIAVRTKKISAEYIEGGAGGMFIAKFNETPFADIKAAWDSDINCCIDLGSFGDNMRVPVYMCTNTRAGAIVPTDNGAVVEVTVTNENVWDFKLRFILPETTNMDVGKFLRVNSMGEWIAAEVPSAEGGSF